MARDALLSTPASDALAAERRARELDRKTQAIAAANAMAPQPVVGRGQRLTPPANTTAELAILSLAPVLVRSGRAYKITAPGLQVFGTATSGANLIRGVLRYTVDGSAVGLTSTVLAQIDVNADTSGHNTLLHLEQDLYPATDGQLAVLLSYLRAAGTGSAGMQGSALYPITLRVEDMGVDPGDTSTSY